MPDAHLDGVGEVGVIQQHSIEGRVGLEEALGQEGQRAQLVQQLAVRARANRPRHDRPEPEKLLLKGGAEN